MATFIRKSLLKLCLGSMLVSSAAFAEVAVIVNPANSNAVDVDAIKRIFLGKQTDFPDGSSAVAIDQTEGSQVVNEFNSKVLDRSASQLKAYWAKLIFTGKGSPPKKVGSDAEVLKIVSSEPDKIGYVDSASVDGSVKVLLKL